MKTKTEYHTSAESFNASNARNKTLSLRIDKGQVSPGEPIDKPKGKRGKWGAKPTKKVKGKTVANLTDFIVYIICFFLLLLFWLSY